MRYTNKNLCFATLFATTLSLGVLPSLAAEAILTVKSSRPTQSLDRARLLGTNAALWHEPAQLNDSAMKPLLQGLNPTFIRIPGGSWSDEYYWNGHDIWHNNALDKSKLVDGVWQVDYSEYSPGFRIQGQERLPSDYHGSEGIDVEYLHQFADGNAEQAIVTVNAGTGTPEMAAEWVRWANIKNNYNVKYWEVGNELEGEWELGHFLPDGSKITGEIYAKRFIEFAKAMKAVDPSIKVGGPTAASEEGGFMEDTLRIAGDYVDFVSFHSYPVEKHLGDEQQIFDQALSLRKSMPKFRAWILKYQPARANEIEIGLTEWNSKVIEDRDTAGMINGLWTCIWVGEMFKNGVTFATQWDMLTTTKEGGHGLFHPTTPLTPKSQYWAMHLWSHHMDNNLLDTELTNLDHAYTAVTVSKEKLSIMVVNTSRDQEASLTLDIPQLGKDKRPALCTTFAQQEYFWNHLEHRPEWSYAPSSKAFTYSPGQTVSVPPFSVRVFEISRTQTPVRSPIVQTQRKNELRFLLPERAPEDLPIEGWVLVGNGGVPSAKQPRFADIKVTGPATLDRDKARIQEAAGRFFLTPTGTGTVTLTAQAGDQSISTQIEIEAVQERPEVVWLFEDDPEHWGASSSFVMQGNDRVRPNQQVASITMNESIPDKGSDSLITFETFPEDFPKERIGGVIFEVQASSDLTCDDDYLGLRVILQSEAAHWIPMGSIDLFKHQGKWSSHTFRLPEAHYFEAMGKTYALRFQLYQKSKNKVPVNGSVYLDNVGFILR